MPKKIPSGCFAIDKFLGGGFEAGSITLIYGEAETGKTTFVMQCAVNCARQGYKTLFIDCDNTFSARRLSQIASVKFGKVADMIILMRPENFREQMMIIDRLTEYLTKNFGLLIVDTVTTLYRLQVAESPQKAFELNRELNKQIALLAQAAKTQKVAVLLTSQVRSLLDNTYVSIEPVATRVLKFWADSIIVLKPTGNPQVIQAVLEKGFEHTKTAEPLTCHLKIEETGIHEY